MSNFINTIDELGDENVFAMIVERTIEYFKDNQLKEIGSSSFYKCASLILVDLASVTKINGMAFTYCSALKSLILRSETMCTIVNTYSLKNTPINSGTGYIYVPKALLSDTDSTMDYRRATNWSTFANQFRALEDYTVDGTITGELDLTKI